MIRTLSTKTTGRLVNLRGLVENSFYLQVVLLLGLYALSHDRWFIQVHVQSFSELSIVFAVLGYSKVLLGSFALAAACILLNRLHVQKNSFYGRLGWSAFNANGDLDIRHFVFVVVLIIAWTFSNYEFNFLYNQAHVLDRVLLIALALLVLVSPYFLPLFALVSFIIFSQFQHAGIGAYAQLDKQPAFDLLILVSVFVIARLFVKVRTTTFVFLAFCLQASFYFLPGLSKLQAGPHPWTWLLENQLHNLFVSSYVNGWLGFASQETILRLADALKIWDSPFQAFTLIIELGMLFLLARKRIMAVFLVGAVALHLGIFAASGIFFWKWSLIDVAFLIFLWQLRSGLR